MLFVVFYLLLVLVNTEQEQEVCTDTETGKYGSILDVNIENFNFDKHVFECKSSSVFRTKGDLFVVPDIHGDFQGLIKALRIGSIINENFDWIASDTIVVQTGDIFDRGPDSKQIVEFLLGLQLEALNYGGCVILLLGNHELLNLQHDFRYASQMETNAFGGLSGRRDAMKSSSEMGQTLRQMRIAVVIDQQNNESQSITRSLLVHAGIRANFLRVFSGSIDRLNTFVLNFLKTNEGEALIRKIYSSGIATNLFFDEGPLWTRFFSIAPKQDYGSICRELHSLLEMSKADRMIIGHTVQESGQPSFRCDGKLILVDVGLSRFYGGGSEFVKILSNGTVLTV